MSRLLRSPRAIASADGFTLVELIIALAILGLALTDIVYRRAAAVERVTKVAEERELRKIAQELLERKVAEFLSDEMQEMMGEIPGRPGWTWEWVEPTDPQNVMREGEEFLLPCTIKIAYPSPDDPEGQESRFELTTWIMPTEELLEFVKEQEAYLQEIGEYGTGTGSPYGSYPQE